MTSSSRANILLLSAAVFPNTAPTGTLHNGAKIMCCSYLNTCAADTFSVPSNGVKKKNGAIISAMNTLYDAFLIQIKNHSVWGRLLFWLGLSCACLALPNKKEPCSAERRAISEDHW